MIQLSNDPAVRRDVCKNDAYEYSQPIGYDGSRISRTRDLAGQLREASSLAQAIALRNEIVVLNLSLVDHALRRWGFHPRRDDDLRSEGTCGLIEAAARFDPARGSMFTGFALLHIRRRVVAWLATRSAFSLPESAGRNLHRLRKAARRIGSNRHPNARQLAQAAGLPVIAVINLRMFLAEPVDITATEISRESICDAKNNHGPEAEEDLALLPTALSRLPERERFVVTATFGLDGAPARDQRDVAAMLGLTRQRVSQIRREALIRMRGAWRD